MIPAISLTEARPGLGPEVRHGPLAKPTSTKLTVSSWMAVPDSVAPLLSGHAACQMRLFHSMNDRMTLGP